MGEFEKWLGEAPLDEVKKTIYNGLAEMQKLRAQFNIFDISRYVEPQVAPVAAYLCGKTLSLVRGKGFYRVNDPVRSEIRERSVARAIVFSPHYSPGIVSVTEKVFFIGSYRQLKTKKRGLPRIEPGIGRCFLRHIADYNNILRILLQQNARRLVSVFESVDLRDETGFIDRFAGQWAASSCETYVEDFHSGRRHGSRRIA